MSKKKTKKNSIGANIMVLISALIVAGSALITYINNAGAEYKVCTVLSAELVSSSAGGSLGPVPTAAVEVMTQECGNLGITYMTMPKGMNKAGLAEFLQANIGKKFEFEVKAISLGNNARDSGGITSTTPIE